MNQYCDVIFVVGYVDDQPIVMKKEKQMKIL
jgi:hypothetical protein